IPCEPRMSARADRFSDCAVRSGNSNIREYPAPQPRRCWIGCSPRSTTFARSVTSSRENSQVTTRARCWRSAMVSQPLRWFDDEQSDLEEAANQAIAACGGDAREAVKALIV